MEENLTTLKRETGRVPAWDEMTGPLIRRLEQVLGTRGPSELPQAVRDDMEALEPRFRSEGWLRKVGRREPGRDKIASGVNVAQHVHKALGGLVRAMVEVRSERRSYVPWSGVYICYPKEAIRDLQSALEGTWCSQARDLLADFSASHDIDTSGVSVDDWLKALPKVS
jgi:hypothetical protein